MHPFRRFPPLLVLLAACGESPGVAPGTTVTDSAGVRIVVSAPDQATPLELETRLAVIGTGEGQGQQLFRVGPVRLLPDGGLVVGERGPAEVRTYDAGGELTGTRARRGEGPGEFQGIGSFQFLPGEYIRVLDTSAGRATIFTPDWEVAGTEAMPAPPGRPTEPMMVAFPGVGFAFTSSGRFVGLPGPTALRTGRPGALPVTAPLTVFDTGGTVMGELEELRLMTFYEVPDAQPNMTVQSGSPRLQWDVRDTRLVVAEGLRHDLAVYDDGMPTLRVREDRPLRPNPAPDTTAAPPTEFLPAYDWVAVDADRRIWARAGAAPGTDSAEWRAFDSDGALWGTLRLPARDRVVDARGDTLILLRRDDMDVERIELWRVTW